ncbi:hypothetical protein JTB14_015571 [Gonioctena quinquepunctata]|nr:hypothetical protein JTB14_015571 [Gonioctena quinquepunctata]
MINAGVLIQNIWGKNIHWDQAVIEDTFEVWLKWLKQLKEVTPIMICRYYFPSLAIVEKMKNIGYDWEEEFLKIRDLEYLSNPEVLLFWTQNINSHLCIDQYHQECGHLGIEKVVNNLRLKYWILNIRAAVKECFNICQLCQNRKC